MGNKLLISLFIGFFLMCILSACDVGKENSIESGKTNLEKEYPNFHFFDDRNYPEGTFNYELFQKSKKKASEQLTIRTEGEWITQGPGNIGARINTIAIHPEDDKIMYIGFSHGGVFKTIDNGNSWYPLFDEQISLAISDIEIDPHNHERIWVGTGDKNISGYPFAGSGIYVSDDGGNIWKNTGMEAESVVTRIEVSNQNPSIIYAAAMGLPFEKNEQRGLYKSIDGGINWEQILFLSDSTGIIDLAVHPQNDQIVYASSWNRIRTNNLSIIDGTNTGIHRSTDGGLSWELLDVGIEGVPISRISLYLHEQDPDILIAGFVGDGDTTFCSSIAHQLQGIYRSDDAGDNWYPIPIQETNGIDCQSLAGFGWYFEPVRVNPQNPNDIFVLGVDLWRTKDNGQNWYQATPVWWSYEVHADKHDLQFNQSNEMILATDGGLYKSDIDNEAWIDIENITTTQFYRVAYNPHQPDLYYGGAQDNGSTSGNEVGINEWERVYGGDGFQMVFHPADPEIFYVETQNGNIRVTTDGGENFTGATKGLDATSYRNWDMPYIMSSFNADILYTGTYRIFKNSTGPDEQWEPISGDLTKGEMIAGDRYPSITTLHESPFNENVLYAGTNDGNVWLTTDGGVNWSICEGLPNRYVTDIKASPYQESWVYVSFSGYKDNDNSSRLYKSKDFGQSWESMSGDLVDIAINDIYIIENNFDNILIVGTDVGVYISRNEGVNWERLGNNMPLVPVYDLEYNEIHNQIIAGTYARGILTFSLDQLNINTEISALDNLDTRIPWKIFPTVTHNLVNIVSDLDRTLHIELINQQGIILESITCHGSIQVDLSNYPAGLYHFRLGKNQYKSVVKQPF